MQTGAEHIRPASYAPVQDHVKLVTKFQPGEEVGLPSNVTVTGWGNRGRHR